MSDLPPLPAGTVVTVGTFDGVHRGHRAVLAEVVARARAAGRASVLVTFEPHPLAVLRPEQAPGRLTTAAERKAALAETDLDYLVVLRFDRELANLEPEAFVRNVLLDRCRMAELVVGHDHGFGRGRQGDLDTLRRLGSRLGFGVDVVGPVAGPEGRTMSSSGIRAAVLAADFAAAARDLGRPYRVSGVVQRGDRRGTSIGVPTVNVAPPEGKLLPPDGVYAVRIEWGGGVAGGMMNQGTRPTIGDGRRWLEAHLFDFEGDLYGREIRIEWVAPLRAIRRFDSLAALQEQLERDRAAARAALHGAETSNRVSAR
ncbi:MAG: bifunctional riboflavin kinase/FAD synthetase [Gemmatimonadales bacterium]|nr:bifunctional riboflavin kinase/FAD synthetase [Gemmatimonadales bacterium]MDX2057282.1 bifunctional riboflavin kinase/FAD synthetase [Gemmatimonadales bacterium]